MKRTLRIVVAYMLTVMLPAHVLAELTIDQLVEEAGLSEGTIAARDLDGWNEPKKIVVRGPELAAEMQAQFPDVEFVAVGSVSQAISAAYGAHAIVGYCDERLVAASQNLVWIQVFSAGAERCLAAPKVGSGDILLTNMQKMAAPVIGEHAIAMMLSLTRRLIQFGKVMNDGNWNPDLSTASGMTSINGKTMLVVGLGGIGTEVARRAAGLGMRVIATRNSSRVGPEFVEYVGLSDELLKLAGQADVVVNALPLTPNTKGLFDSEFFDAVKPGVVFISVGRGRSTVTDDLVSALRDGRVASAGLDVTDPEPLPPQHPLWRMSNVIITPHVASDGDDRERIRVVASENIRRYIAGERLLNVVDPASGY